MGALDITRARLSRHLCLDRKRTTKRRENVQGEDCGGRGSLEVCRVNLACRVSWIVSSAEYPKAIFHCSSAPLKEGQVDIFLDSSKLQEIKKWMEQGVIDGVTTNPTIMFKDGVRDLESCTRGICAVVGERPVSVEVTTNDHEEMLEQARVFANWSPHIVVKIPIVNQDGVSSLRVIHKLTSQNISVNATAILSFNQALLAAKAGATYISIFGGRMADEGNDPAVTIRNVHDWLDMWGYTAKIIVGSIRGVIDVQSAALAGAHIITIPPQFLPKMVDHKYTRDTVRQFNEDATKVAEQIIRAKAAAAE